MVQRHRFWNIQVYDHSCDYCIILDIFCQITGNVEQTFCFRSVSYFKPYCVLCGQNAQRNSHIISKIHIPVFFCRQPKHILSSTCLKVHHLTALVLIYQKMLGKNQGCKYQVGFEEPSILKYHSLQFGALCRQVVKKYQNFSNVSDP